MRAIALYDVRGRRKYLTAKERRSFAVAALRSEPGLQTFCLTLIYTGARLSEVLAITPERIDQANKAIVFETLKRRRSGVFRAVPVPPELVRRVLEFSQKQTNSRHELRIWTWGRTTAWKRVKEVMRTAGIDHSLATPKAARHGFGVNAIQSGVALNILQRWMGHARIETTAIYADALGREEWAVAKRTWATLRNFAALADLSGEQNKRFCSQRGGQ